MGAVEYSTIEVFVEAICWERRPSTNAVFGRLSAGPGSSDPPNSWYFSQADNRPACQLSCEQEAACHAYSFILNSHPDVAERLMCHGISESLATRQQEANVVSGYKVDCGSQTGKICRSRAEGRGRWGLSFQSMGGGAMWAIVTPRFKVGSQSIF